MNNFCFGFVIATILSATAFIIFWPAKPKPRPKPVARRSHHKRKEVPQ